MGAAFHKARGGLLVIPALLAIAACQAAATGPIVYTAPPDIMDRTYPPVPSDSVDPSAASSPAPSAVDQLPSAEPASGAPVRSASLGRPDPGTILFGTAVGTDSCSVSNPATVLLSTQPFFFAARLNDQMDGTKAIVLSIMRNGELVVDHEEPADGKAFDCYGNTSPLGTLQPGDYDFRVRQGTKLEAEGKVTVR
jgi:hypothetical protein